MVHMILTGGHARRPILVLVRGMTFIIRPFRLQGSGPRRVGKVWKKALTRWFVERVLGEQPKKIVNDGAVTTAVQDLSNKSMSHSRSK